MTRFERILCPVDFSDGAKAALAAAGAMADWYGATLTIVHVHANWPMADMIPSLRAPGATPAPMADEERDAMRGALQRFGLAAGLPAGLDVRYEVAEGLDVVGEILRRSEDCDGLVIGTHGRTGFERLLLGSVAERVLRAATCPVLVVPPQATWLPRGAAPGRRILCPVDFSDASLAAFEYAAALAEESDGTLTLLHVIEVPPELRETPVDGQIEVDLVRAAAEAECLRRLRALVPESVRESCTVRTEVAEGRAAREILRAAEEGQDDLIVIGVRGRNAVDLLVFGSSTQYVVRSAKCPVLVVHGAAHPLTVKRAS